MEELKIELFGRVQGVGFRHFVKENADKIGIKGRVLNRDDGSVLVIAQAERHELEIFLSVVQRGPSLSKVDGVSYFWRSPEEKYEDFTISLDRGIISDQKRSFTNLGKRILSIGAKNKENLHVSIIPDGNRRWAKTKGLKAIEGHYRSASYNNIMNLFNEAKDLNIKYLTFWGFSTENWNRSKREVNGLFDLVLKTAKKLRSDAEKNKVRFRHIGRKDRLPKELVKELEMLEKETEKFGDFNVQLCLDYGGRDEIVRAVNKILRTGVSEVKEDDLVNHLDSSGIPDPDLIIRTSGENRTSGFMPFQSVYSELYFSDVHFPEFGPRELRKAVEEFQRRNRRFGK